MKSVISNRFQPRMFLHAVVGFAVAVAVLQPVRVAADVASKSGDKAKKDPDEKKKKDKKTDYLPEARRGVAKFTAGIPVDVELVAAVGSLKQLEFVIRQMPQNGTLSAIRPNGREGNKAVVTYTHAGGEAPLSDSFTYACRLDGGSWSAPATVTLSGDRLEPKIEVTNLPQFPRVFLGGETSARMMLRNTGLADFHMEVKWPEPFIGPPIIEVPKGGTREYQVFARPGKTGDARYELVLQPGVREARAIFYVVCVQALAVSPSRLVLVLDSKGGERSGVLSLANARFQPVLVVMKHPARLVVPSEIEVPAGSRSDLRIALPAGDVDSFSGEIEVVSGDDVQKVYVEAGPKPALLQVLVPASLALDFGAVDQYTTPSREVVLGNGGGQTLVIAGRVLPPFQLSNMANSVRIEPGKQARLKVVLQTDRSGPVTGELDLDSSSAGVKLALTADVRERKVRESSRAIASSPQAPPSPSTAATADSSPSAFTGDVGAGPFSEHSELQSVIMAMAASRGMPIPRSLVSPFLASIPSIEFISATSSEVTIAWPKPAVIPPGWVIELASQILDPNTGYFVKLWTRHRDWETVEIDGDRIAVRLQKLQPASIYEVRVLAVDREGKVSEPAATKLIQTAPAWTMPSWVWRTLVFAVLGVIAYRLYRMRNGRFSLAAA